MRTTYNILHISINDLHSVSTFHLHHASDLLKRKRTIHLTQSLNPSLPVHFQASSYKPKIAILIRENKPNLERQHS